MDTDKLNSVKLRAFLYLTPFVLMLAGSFSYIIEICRDFPLSASLPLVAFQCLFLLSLSALFANLTTEIYLTLFQRAGKSEIDNILYGGSSIFPLRAGVFVTIFILGYILLTQVIPYQSTLQTLMLLIPSVAIFMNAHHFISGRIRCIGGVYLIFKERFSVVFFYYVDDSGYLCIFAQDGQSINTGVKTTDIDFEKLEAEFAQNGLKRNQVNH
jgi:hypothetical protein